MPRYNPKKYYPIGLDIRGKSCLVVGGGRVAERKVRRLLEYGAAVKIVSPRITSKLQAWFRRGLLKYQKGEFSGKFSPRPFLVFALTDNLALNRRIARKAQKENVPVNVAEPGMSSTFILPAIFQRLDFTVAVSTDGNSPRTAKKIKEKLEGLL